ncbi:ubiquinol-cytochrome c reductase core subunit 1 [Coelomomyces lativittatus]|nr:ubiquinol-cytochrome c reductase core subunit 1 [Coelomomyces lativittatus]
MECFVLFILKIKIKKSSSTFSLYTKYTTTRSPVAIAREIDLRGIQLNLALDREFLDIRANFERDDLEFVVDLIADVVQNTKFNHWEFELVQEKVKEEAEKVWKNSSKAAFELVHQLAFRDGLGNSTVAMPSHTIKNKDVVAFSQRYLGLSTASKWVGVGVNASTLTQLCESHFKSTLNPSHSKLVESKYKGGSQTRLDLPGPSHITLAFPAPALTNPMQIASYHSLKSLVQSTPSVKWGNKSFPLTEGPLLVFLTSYSDSGLFGLTSTSDDPEVCTSTIQTCIDQLRNIVSGKVNTSQIKKAISQAKFESIAETQMEKAVQLATGQSQVTEAFDKLTENDLVKTIETVLKTKPVLVAAGKTHALPHLDTFKF